MTTISVDLSEKELKSLEQYRKQLNRTHGTSYADLQEALDDLTKKYLGSLVNQVRLKRREKVSKAYRFADKVKQDKVDKILGIKDDE